jgi:hypothetical protein
MFLTFPNNTFATVTAAYARPYDDPLAVAAEERVVRDPAKRTDLIGWVWCKAADGREGWVPQAWLGGSDGSTLLRDFSAIELTVAAGDRLRLMYAESGFVWCQAQDGRRGWVPDAVLALESC